MDSRLASLTEAQREAVEHADGPLLILAGPGSGKTRVVTHRVARLLEKGIPARQILALTFTNKAADEMRTRLAGMVPHEDVWVGTFHRFCARLLRRHAPLVGLAENFTIYDADDSLRTIKRATDRLGSRFQGTNAAQVAAAISRAKNNMINHRQCQQMSGDSLVAAAAEIYPAYQRELLASNAVDFDDLLLYVADLMRENPPLRSEWDARYRYVLVDEYQDTNLVQYAIVRGLSIDYPNLAVTGDPDQSIYGWRGANLRNILDFEKDFPRVRVVRLEANYRSTPNILDVADALIARNLRRKQKHLIATKRSGRRVRLVHYTTEKHEAEGIAAEIAEQIHAGSRRPRDFAIFYRVNALSRAVEEALRIHAVPYQVVSGVEFYQRKEIKDVLSYLLLINNPRDNAAFLRVVNEPGRGIGKTTLKRLGAHADQLGISLLEAARHAGLIPALGRRAVLALAKFVSLYDRMCESGPGPVEIALTRVLDLTGYREHLQQSSSETDQQRLANIEELITVAREFDVRAGREAGLEAFLEQTCLVNDTDDWDPEIDRVSLMTLHASKGLGFPAVYIIALEEGLLPHERSREKHDQLEEERRLLFVGITRAEEQLQLSMVHRRNYRGREGRAVPSSFTMELPRAEMELIGTPVASDDLSGAGDDWECEGPVWGEEDFVQDAPAEPCHDTNSLSYRVMTAAQLVDSRTPRAEPDGHPGGYELRLGMAVVHPEHGPGKVIGLTGEGKKLTATVNFALQGEKTFCVAHAPLRPAVRAK